MVPMQDQILIRHICNGAAIRLASLPGTHPLSKDIARAAKRRPIGHPSPLHIVLNTSKYTMKNTNMEKIETTPRNPGCKPRIEPRIAENRREGIEMDRRDDNDIKIYTDGSGHDGGIGAAAVLYHGFKQAEVARKYLGKEDEHTVFEAECTGQLLALQLLKKKVKAIKLGQRTAKATIAVDNQESLRCHTRREQQPGTYIIEAVHKAHTDIMTKHPNLRITYRWVPGHEDIPGSDRADEEAKRAAEGRNRDTKGLEGILKKSLPSAKQQQGGRAGIAVAMGGVPVTGP